MIQLESELDPLKRLSLQDFSYSRISCFNDCQLKYFYSYIIKVPQDFGHPAKLGNIIHEALELTLENELSVDKFELLSAYQDARLRLDPAEEIPQAMIDEGQRMLIEFADRLNAQPIKISTDHEDYDFEKEKPFSFVSGRGRINGFIDYVSVREDRVFVRDYKSGKNEVPQKHVHSNLQLGVYSLFMKYLHPDKPIQAELYYLKSDHKKSHLFTDDDLDLIETELNSKINIILSTEDFKPTIETWRCEWCSYATDGTCPQGNYRLKKKGKIPWD